MIKPDKMDVMLEKKITDFLREGRKIEAIAAVQNQMKLGLKNSKDLVDSLEESLASSKIANPTKRNL